MKLNSMLGFGILGYACAPVWALPGLFHFIFKQRKLHIFAEGPANERIEYRLN